MRKALQRTLAILACCLWLTGPVNKPAGAAAENGETTMGIQTETVTVNDFSMDYIRFGHGDRVLVILPGLSVESVMKYGDAVAQAYAPLTDAFTIYLFDRRKELPETYSIYDMARDTLAAFDALDLGPVNLFGASQGGMIAMTIAAEAPERVAGLVLGSTAARVDPVRYPLFDEWIRLAKEGDAEALYLAFGKAIYPPVVFEQSRDLLAASAAGVTEKDLARFVILAEGIRDFDVTDRLGNITCPVLILGSKDDSVLGGEASEEIAEKLKDRPDCELFLYDGYGHAVYDLAPDYKTRMLRFLVPETAE